MKRLKNGSALSQYGIIIVLVSLALIPIFYIFGMNIVTSFTNFSQLLAGNQVAQSQTSNIANNSNSGNIAPANNNTTNKTNNYSSNNNTNYNQNAAYNMPLNTQAANTTDSASASEQTIQEATQDAPVKKCINGLCTIDFGDFVLSGIPENFSEIVQASGTSGGTREILKLIEQIALQIEASGDEEGAKDFKDLANLGHFIASTEENIEQIASTCENNGNNYSINALLAGSCMTSNMSGNIVTSVPSNVKHLLPYLNPEYIDTSKYTKFLSLQSARKEKVQVSSAIATGGIFNEMDKKVYPSYAMIDLYQKIQDNSNYSNKLKTITTELVSYISELSHNQSSVISTMQGMNGSDKKNETINFVTGEVIYAGSSGTTVTQTLDDILHPQASFNTDVNSALICATGRNIDSGKKCH